MELSARNQIAGTITNIDLGAVMADVTLDSLLKRGHHGPAA